MYFAKTDTSPRTQDSPHKERPKFQQVPYHYSVVPILLFLQKFGIILLIVLQNFLIFMEVLLSVEILGFPTSVAATAVARLVFTSLTFPIWQKLRIGIHQLLYFLTQILRCIEKFIRGLQSVRFFRANFHIKIFIRFLNIITVVY